MKSLRAWPDRPLFKALLVGSAFVLSTMFTPVASAPLTAPSDLPTAKGADAAQQSGQALSEATSGSETQGQSRTVRMLLEMQNAPPPLEGTGTSKREEDARIKAARMAQGAETVITAEEGKAVVDWRAGLPGRNVNSTRVADNPTPAQTAPAQRQFAGDTVNLKEVMPDNWFTYLRAHREWVLVGGVVALFLAWLLASALSSRR